MFQKLNEVLYDGNFELNGQKSFAEHYKLVKSLVPPEKLLEYNINEGWEPLCRFLGKPIPSEPMPFINQSAGFKEKFRTRNIANVQAQLRRTLDVMAYIVLVISLVATLT